MVGGGPGGAAAAGYMAMEGKRVLLIEKETWPRDKICGDAVGGKSLSHVKELGVKEILEGTPHFRVTGIVFSSPKGHSVRVPLPEEDVQRLAVLQESLFTERLLVSVVCEYAQSEQWQDTHV